MDFLLTLLLIPFAAPLVLGFVNMCCCQSGLPSACPTICNPAASSVTVVMSGFSDNACLSCSYYNVTWVANCESGGTGFCNCTYVEGDFGCAGGPSPQNALTVEFRNDGGNLRIEAYVTASGTTEAFETHWRDITGPAVPANCATVGTKVLPVLSHTGGGCNHDGSSATITTA